MLTCLVIRVIYGDGVFSSVPLWPHGLDMLLSLSLGFTGLRNRANVEICGGPYRHINKLKTFQRALFKVLCHHRQPLVSIHFHFVSQSMCIHYSHEGVPLKKKKAASPNAV